MAASAHPQLLTSTLLELADTLSSDYDLHDYLDMLLARSSAMLDAEAGGVVLTDGRGDLHVLASTDEHMHLIELLQLQSEEGPCVEAYQRGVPVVDEDLAISARWPQFAAVAVEQGFGAAFAFPMRLRGHVIGALNLLRQEPGPVGQMRLEGTEALAHMAAIGILQERAVREARELAGHLQTALNSRIVIEQAKGMLAEHTGCRMDEAYQILRLYCRHNNARMHETATAITSGSLVFDAVMAGQPPP